MTWTLVNLRGLQQMMLDMIDNPDGLHRLIAFLRDGHLRKLDFLEANGLLSLNNDDTYVGSGGFGWSHALPQPDFAATCAPLTCGASPRARRRWASRRTCSPSSSSPTRPRCLSASG
ncbi:MAG: hypothetical protein M5R40_29965 [Anaerolineae bacterium]|nr:hypothetical protein [Anaerolineae bacterium]